jgi:hypothetical protein
VAEATPAAAETPAVEVPEAVAEAAVEPDGDREEASAEPRMPEVSVATVRWALTAVAVLILLAVLARLFGVF